MTWGGCPKNNRFSWKVKDQVASMVYDGVYRVANMVLGWGLWGGRPTWPTSGHDPIWGDSFLWGEENKQVHVDGRVHNGQGGAPNMGKCT